MTQMPRWFKRLPHQITGRDHRYQGVLVSRGWTPSSAIREPTTSHWTKQSTWPEPSAVQADVYYIWRYAVLVVHTIKEEEEQSIYDFVWPQWVRMHPRKMRSCHRRARHHTQGLPSASQLHVSGVRINRCLAEQTDKLTSPACNDFTGQEPSRVRTIISRMDKYHQLS